MVKTAPESKHALRGPCFSGREHLPLARTGDTPAPVASRDLPNAKLKSNVQFAKSLAGCCRFIQHSRSQAPGVDRAPRPTRKPSSSTPARAVYLATHRLGTSCSFSNRAVKGEACGSLPPPPHTPPPEPAFMKLLLGLREEDHCPFQSQPRPELEAWGRPGRASVPQFPLPFRNAHASPCSPTEVW